MIDKLYKYLPRRFANSVLLEGKILFRNLTYFRQVEDNGRGDIIEGIHVDHPDNPIRVQSLDGRVDVSGNFAFHNAISQDRVFVFCLSKRFSQELFDEFEADACIEIFDVPKFIFRVQCAVKRSPTLNKYGLLHSSVDYYRPNETVDRSIKDPKNLSFFKHHRFSHQEEYRLVCGEKNALTLRQSIVNMDRFEISEEIRQGHRMERLLRVGKLTDVARLYKVS